MSFDRQLAMDALENLDDDSIVEFWNDYCDENSSAEDRVYNNCEEVINEQLFTDPWTAVQATVQGDYRTADIYVCLSGYGNLWSFNTMYGSNCPVDFDALLDWMEGHLDLEELSAVLGIDLENNEEDEDE